MALKQPVEGDISVLNDLASVWNGGSLYLFLFNSNYTPTNTDTIATYSGIQPSWSGYAGIALNSWGSAAADGAGRGVIVHPVQTFLCTFAPAGPDTAYGYFVADSALTRLYWAEKAATPVTITNAGDFVSVLPRYTQKSEF